MVNIWEKLTSKITWSNLKRCLFCKIIQRDLLSITLWNIQLDRTLLNVQTPNFTSWQSANTKNSTLVFLLAAPRPQQRHPQTPTHNPTEKSWGNGRASPYKGNKGTGRERGEDRGWWRGSTQCVEIGRPELVGGKASKAGAQPPHSPQLRGLWRQRTTASLFLSFALSLSPLVLLPKPGATLHQAALPHACQTFPAAHISCWDYGSTRPSRPKSTEIT